MASDPFSLVFVFMPALALLAVDAFPRTPAYRQWTSLPPLAVGIALGLALPSTIAWAGGFTTENIVVTGFVAPQLLGRNLAALFAGVAILFGANPPRVSASPLAWMLFALRFGALSAALVAAARVGRKLFDRDTPPIDRLLCAGVLSDLVACASSAQFGKGIPRDAWSGGPPMRYAMPAFLLLSVLAARQVSHWLSILQGSDFRKWAPVALAFGATCICAGNAAMVDAKPTWMGDNASVRAARWLADRGLTDGRGEYWSANLVTAMSGNRIGVRSVVPDDGKLVAYVLAADRNWFDKSPQFVIWRDDNKTGVTLAEVRRTYAIGRIDSVAGYRIATVVRCEGSTPELAQGGCAVSTRHFP